MPQWIIAKFDKLLWLLSLKLLSSWDTPDLIEKKTKLDISVNKDNPVIE